MSDELDRPYGDLPSVGRLRLRASQLEAAVFEVRYVADSAGLSDADAQSMLGLFPTGGHLEPAAEHEVAFTLGPDGQLTPSASVSGRGWQVSVPEQGAVYTILPAQASVQVSVYERWSDSMKPAVDRLLEAAHQTVAPKFCQRIGLRYINRIDGDRARWDPMLGAALSAIWADPVFGRRVGHVHGEIGLDLEPNVRVMIRHGVVPEPPAGPGGYLIDLDGSIERTQPFDAPAIAALTQRMNRTLLSVLNALLSPRGVEQMDPEPLDAIDAEQVS